MDRLLLNPDPDLRPASTDGRRALIAGLGEERGADPSRREFQLRPWLETFLA
jgi:hypothetical protein